MFSYPSGSSKVVFYTAVFVLDILKMVREQYIKS
jgi:hypothetical protein